MNEDEMFQIGLFELAQQLHMSLSGAADPLRPDEEKAVVGYLRKRLREWRPTRGKGWQAYDDAAKALVAAAIREWDSR